MKILKRVNAFVSDIRFGTGFLGMGVIAYLDEGRNPWFPATALALVIVVHVLANQFRKKTRP